jgi:hypothetical protein
VLRRGSSGDAVKQAVDRLGNLVQLGCSDEIADACTLLSDGRAAEALAALDGSASVGAYVRGCEAMAADEYEAAQRELEAALPGLGESAAHVRALTMLAALAHVRRDDAGRAALTDRAKAITPHLEQEIDQFSRNPALCGELLASTLLPGRGEGPRNARLRHARDSLKRAGARLRTGSVTTGPGNGSTDPGGPH